jgi:hypothetical protein
VTVQTMAAVWETDVPPLAKLVMLAIEDGAGDRHHPDIPRVAAKTGLSERDVDFYLHALAGRGYGLIG